MIMKTPLKHLSFALPALVLLASTSLRAEDGWNRPDNKPQLRLFYAPLRHDYLAVYREYSQANYSVRLRAYWLGQGHYSGGNAVKPHFVDAAAARTLHPVPVFTAATNIPSPLYSICQTNDGEFILYRSNRVPQVCRLPVYQDGPADDDGNAGGTILDKMFSALLDGAFNGNDGDDALADGCGDDDSGSSSNSSGGRRPHFHSGGAQKDHQTPLKFSKD
ncbi:MAG TPA: hypothetical protein VFV81_08860 [Verrucomicrobiae bacterium]|nr:hypothetical protein [Verrucomicrobiae bacterium]